MLMDTISKDQYKDLIKMMVMIHKKRMMTNDSSKTMVMNSMDPYLGKTENNRLSVEEIRWLNLLWWDDWQCFIAGNDDNSVGEQYYT